MRLPNCFAISLQFFFFSFRLSFCLPFCLSFCLYFINSFSSFACFASFSSFTRNILYGRKWFPAWDSLRFSEIPMGFCYFLPYVTNIFRIFINTGSNNVNESNESNESQMSNLDWSIPKHIVWCIFMYILYQYVCIFADTNIFVHIYYVVMFNYH